MITEEEKQNREKLFRLMKENPDLPVLPLVESCTVPDDSHDCWAASWGSVYIGEYLVASGIVRARDDDNPTEVYGLLSEIMGDVMLNNFTNDDLIAIYKKLPWMKAIIVYIGPVTDEADRGTPLYYGADRLEDEE